MNAGLVLFVGASKRLKNRGRCCGCELMSSTRSRAFLRIRRKNLREGLFLFRCRAIMMMDAVYIEKREYYY